MKLFLIDGHALVFKMYYAFLGRPMINSKGMDTSILFGFTKYLVELIEKERPTHIAVSFDPPGGTFRNQMYPEYKANRAETPQLVIDALEPLTEIVRAMDIPVLMVKGFEADDVIGSMARRSAAEGFEVYMVTPDKDYGQLVDSSVFQYKPGKSGSESEVLGPAEICAKWGIDRTSQVVDILALCGDSADNVPGVQGVGPVGAAKLLKKYGDVDGIYSHLDELTPRQKQLFEAASGHIGLSRELVTIKTDIPLETTAEDMLFDMKVTPELLRLFDLYEFNSLRRKLSAIAVDGGSEPVPAEKPAADLSFEKVSASGFRPRGSVSMVLDETSGTLTLFSSGKLCSALPEEVRGILEDESVTKVGADLKHIMNYLAGRDIVLGGRLRDVSLVHYILNPERSHSVASLASSYLGVDLDSISGEAGPQTMSLFDDPEAEIGKDMSIHAVALCRLDEILWKELGANDASRLLYEEIEEPLVRVLSRMETVGVKIDMASLKSYADSLRVRMAEEEAKVREIAGLPGLNVSSPKQIGELVFERLKLDPQAKKPRSGNWPADEQTLSELADRSPVIDAILEYRGLRKLLSTYIDPFPSYIKADGRVHTTFNQALTSTGRLSSSNPNLQNIPIRTDDGREIRKAFVPGRPGCVIMSADYSQIELRIMAHLCGDEHMCRAFREGVDVHSATAARIFDVDVSEVTAQQRRIAKTANFGILYGISAFGLSQRLKCSRTEAKQIIDDYFESFPSIRGFIDGILVKARSDGFVETMSGRRRYIPDINSSNANLRAVAERNAVNAPVQGTAADIIKMAMNAVDRRLREEGLESRMVLQIHDELLLEVPEAEVERVREILVSEMEGVVRLSVPLTVECNYGKTWLDAH